MKEILFKICKFFLNFILILVALMSLAASGIVIASNYLPNINEISIVYVLIGEFLAPIEFLVNNKLGSFYTSNMKTLCIVMGIVISFLCFICIHQFRKIGKINKKTGRNKNSFVKTMLCSLVLIAYFSFNLVFLFMQYKVIKRYYTKTITGMVADIIEKIGYDSILIKGICICGVIAIFAFMVFILNFVNKEKNKEKTGRKAAKEAESLTFYSDEFIQNTAKESAVSENEEAQLVETVRGTKKRQAEDLVTKIMQLNKLKDSGQITEVEYTKLRQKAIRRYKG